MHKEQHNYPTSKHFIPDAMNIKNFRTYLNSSLSVFNSCSMYRKTCTSSLTITGHREVACCGDIRKSNTRKHRNTCA